MNPTALLNKNASLLDESSFAVATFPSNGITGSMSALALVASDVVVLKNEPVNVWIEVVSGIPSERKSAVTQTQCR